MYQSIKEANGKIFMRFYDYGINLIRFNILIIEKTKNGISHSLNTVPLDPWKADNSIRLLHEAGCTNVNIFGSIAMHKFNEMTSKDIVPLALQTM